MTAGYETGNVLLDSVVNSAKSSFLVTKSTAITIYENVAAKQATNHRWKQIWVAFLTNVLDVDILRCLRFSGRIKIISFMKQLPIFRRILKYLKLWKYPRGPPDQLEMVYETEITYVPW